MTTDGADRVDALTVGRALDTAFARLDLGCVVQRADGTIVDANEAAAHLLGLTLDQLLGRDSYDPRWRAVSEDGEPMPGDRHPAMVALASGQEVHDVLVGVEVPDAGLRWLTVSSFPLRAAGADPSSAPVAVTTVFRDVTEDTRADRALRTWERRFRMAAEMAPVGIAILGMDGRAIRANPAFQRLFDRTEAQMQAEPWWRALPIDGDRDALVLLGRDLASRSLAEVRQDLTLETEPPRTVRVHAGVLSTVDPIEIVVVAQDVTDEVARQSHLEQQARHDSLTGVLHLAALLDLAESRPDGGHRAVLFVDVDGFKQVNDSHGHEVGDVLLTEVAERLTRVVRDGDLVARAGGDEFVVLLQDLPDAPAACDVAERIVRRSRVPTTTPMGPVTASVSVGVAFGAGTDDLSGLLRRADRAMYRAKAAGRDRVEIDP